VQIDPATGKVVAFYDFSALYPSKERSSIDQVLNGIAYDPAEDVFYLTGKWWPKYYKGACRLCRVWRLWRAGAPCHRLFSFVLAGIVLLFFIINLYMHHTTVKICGLAKDEGQDGVCAVNSAGSK
jgi:hypothetical protein